MENERNYLTCPKCGNEVELTENQNIGHCSFCDSLIPLPYFMINQDAVDKETYHNMLNRINKANAFTLSYQFHRAFNLYDKLIKNNFNLNINDYYPYFGKALAQYGVYFVMNDKLENELICLKLVKESIFENENYVKALEYSDANTEAIIKQIATQIDQFQKDLQKSLVDTEPVDVCVLVDTSSNNKDAKIDSAVGIRIKEKLAKMNYTANVTTGLLEKIDKDFVINLYKNLTLANHLVVVSTDHNHLNSPLFRHIWMTYYSDDELSETITNRMSIVTDDLSIKNDLPIANINFFKTTALDDHFNNLVSCLSTIKLYEEECTKAMPTHSDILKLLSEKKFEEVRDNLNNKLENESLDYIEWWLMFLAKHQASTKEELLSKIINPDDSYYFQKAYLVSPRFVKRNLYEYYKAAIDNLNNLSIVDEKYEDEIVQYQKAIVKKETTKLFFSIIPVILATILDFATFSITNVWSVLLMLIINTACYIVFGKQFFKVLNIGKIPDSIRSETDKQSYLQQIKKVLNANQAAKFIPSEKTKKMHMIGFITLACCFLMTLSFFVKETAVSTKNKNLNYYYVFNSAVVTGGRGEEITIPVTINKRPVTRIGKDAFKGSKNIKTVIISNGVKEISSSAFQNCENLENVTVPATIKRVDAANPPFEGCNNLKQFLYQGNDITPSEFLGTDYQEKMFNINFIKK